MLARVFGIETEYGITCAALTGESSLMGAEEAAALLFAPLSARSGSTNSFLTNGARLYLDIGAHPEYATAECSTLGELLANDRAGDVLYAQMAATANHALAAQEVAGKIHLFKNNHDAQGNSYGSHENYLVRRRRDYATRLEEMIPFLVTRQILVGAGYLCRQDGKAHFELSQRASQMYEAVSTASTNARPMINTRDEPHGDMELYRRMHVIVGDSNICDATTALKIGMTRAVLDYIESGKRLKKYQLLEPMRAIRQTSLDLSGKAVLECVDGSTITALDLQEYVFEQVLSFYQTQAWLDELDPLQTYVFQLWEKALLALRAGDTSSIECEIDWVAKLKLLQHYQEKLGVSLADVRMARLDLAWHDITNAGLRTSLEQQGGLRTLVTPTQIASATTLPPQTTRAKVRGDFIAAALDARRDYEVDWASVGLFTGTGIQSVNLKDPFAVVDEKVEALMWELES